MEIAGRGCGQFKHRFPDGLKERLRAAATANGRSMTAEINDRLEASFATSASIHPEVARLIDRHIEDQVAARLRKIAASIGGDAA